MLSSLELVDSYAGFVSNKDNFFKDEENVYISHSLVDTFGEVFLYTQLS